MWIFRLFGRVSSSTDRNFIDWEFKQLKYREGDVGALQLYRIYDTEYDYSKANGVGDLSWTVETIPFHKSISSNVFNDWLNLYFEAGMTLM